MRYSISDRSMTEPSFWRQWKRNDRTTNERPQTGDDVLAAFATMSRRIDDLARELKCLGYFDEDSDRPKAA